MYECMGTEESALMADRDLGLDTAASAEAAAATEPPSSPSESRSPVPYLPVL